MSVNDYDKCDRFLSSFTRFRHETKRKARGFLHEDEPFSVASIRPAALLEYKTNHFLPNAPQIYHQLKSWQCEVISDNFDCGICQNRLRIPADHETQEQAGSNDVPVRLPCGHIFGYDCLLKWSWPFGQGETCPMCRRKFLKPVWKSIHPERCEDIGAHERALDEVSWADFTGAKRLDSTNSFLMESCRFWIAAYHFGHAKAEILKKISLPAAGFDTEKWRLMAGRLEDMRQCLLHFEPRPKGADHILLPTLDPQPTEKLQGGKRRLVDFLTIFLDVLAESFEDGD